MALTDNDARVGEVVYLLEHALMLLDEMEEHSAAAQVDNVLHLIQESLKLDR